MSTQGKGVVPVAKKGRSSVVASLLCLAVAGCSSGAPTLNERTTLPFVVAVNEIRHVQANDSRGGDALGSDQANSAEPSTNSPGGALTTPGDFSPSGLRDLTQRLVEGLRSAQVFTEVITAESKGYQKADLWLTLTFEGVDFGERRIKAGGAALSLGVWLVLGPVGWLVGDSYYPDSTIRLNVSLAEPGKPEAPLYEDKLILQGLPLSFTDRFTFLSCCANILIPSFFLNGSAEKAGSSLASFSVDQFLSEGVNRLATLLPARYQEAKETFVLPERDDGGFLVISKRALDEIDITCEARATPRKIVPDDSLVRVPISKKIRDAIGSSRDVDWDENDHAYSVGFESYEVGLVRVKAKATDQEGGGQWTIRRLAGK